MRVRIKKIHKSDAFFEVRTKYIGLEGEFTPGRSDPDLAEEWKAGEFTNREKILYFAAVKLESLEEVKE